MRVALLLVLLCLAGCAKDLNGTEPTTQAPKPSGPSLQYLGVGGWLLHWRGETLLLAPSFSNPAFPPVFVKANEQRIDDLMPDARDAKVLLIGHAHYDHLLDVPHIMRKQAPQAIAYGNEEAGHLLAGAGLKSRFVNMQPKMVTVRRGNRAKPQIVTQDRWEPNGAFRFMAIESQHAPHIAGINLLEGTRYREDLTQLPTYVRRWPGGQTLAWLIDLLDEKGEPVYRIHYQDSASNPPYGFPPILQDGKRIDIAIICAASTDQVQLYPDALLDVIKPRLMVYGHWEDFFGNEPSRPQLIRVQDENALIDRLKANYPEIKQVMPYPLTYVPLPPPESHGKGH
ncbi:MBL fold metallo-hydrolase [Pseudomonas sp. UFMG81]|jgi:hypothetical protein|uniref:MBL fold metallo-hydrolase n=1 Tax=Pseudomonas sp. UFMG81 TaxID=2745936 RepID=UPI00188E3966|nr:MBL fold metallo-hydrolase [Pseudomonas sp. UFMG81]